MRSFLDTLWTISDRIDLYKACFRCSPIRFGSLAGLMRSGTVRPPRGIRCPRSPIDTNSSSLKKFSLFCPGGPLPRPLYIEVFLGIVDPNQTDRLVHEFAIFGKSAVYDS